jgi:hypothetical protein
MDSTFDSKVQVEARYLHDKTVNHEKLKVAQKSWRNANRDKARDRIESESKYFFTEIWGV